MAEVPLATQHTVVSMAARGRTHQSIADRTTLPVATVRAIAEKYGSPDMGRLAWAADELRRQLDKETTHPSAASAALADGIAVVRAEAERVGAAKLVRRADWIASHLDQLRVDVVAAVEEWGARAAERAKLEAEAARLKAERETKVARLAELEAEAARLKAELRGKATTKASAASTSDARAIREWAAAAGVECPKAGRIPRRVREAYESREAA